jgi:hypothetical protein
MLRALITLLRGGLDSYLPMLVNSVGKCFQDRRDSLKLDGTTPSLTHLLTYLLTHSLVSGLIFLRVTFEYHSPQVLHSLITTTLPLVITTGTPHSLT